MIRNVKVCDQQMTAYSQGQLRQNVPWGNGIKKH